MYETKDISLAAYINLKGEKISIKKNKNTVSFVFDNDVSKLVDAYYEDEEKYLTYSNILRNIKSRLINTLKGDN